ncbi:MAG: DUF481 domain-containing protein [Gemmatimonadota bacterium]
MAPLYGRLVPISACLGACALILLIPTAVHGDTGAGSEPPEPLRVFLDCPSFICDSDFFQTEVMWVDWVRNRQDADVHVLVTSQTTGGGGRLFDISFEGRSDFAGERFTLTRHTQTDASPDDRRRAILHTLTLGLVRYASETPVAERLRVRFEPESSAGEDPDAAPAPGGARGDPWNFWVFSTSARAFLNGESQAGAQNYNGSLSATRTTEEWKFRFNGNGSYGENRFELPDRTVRSITRSYTGTGMVVRSLGDRWSTGMRVRARKSTFQNYDLVVEAGPAGEFSFFPYSESTRRALTAEYALHLAHFDYTEETLFDQLQETRWEQNARVSLNLNQPWGSANTTASFSQFLHDTSQNRISFSTGLNARLFRGFSLNVNGVYSVVRNQLNLPKRGASEEEVLLRRRQLSTNYQYFTSFGITYSFGSIYSQIVNPRMDSWPGGGSFFF